MTTWTLSTWTDAARLAAAVDPRAVPAEAQGKPPRDWFVRLRDEGEPVDAVMFLAHAMPRYECIVWAARSLVEAGGIDRTDPGFVAALRWIDNPSDKLRRTAGDHAETADEDAPSTVLCRAVYLSGGSLAPEDLPAVQPPPDACAKLAAAAVLQAAYAADDPAPAIARSLALGEEILAGS